MSAEKTDLGREPPHSVEAEQSLISACLIDGRETIERCLTAQVESGFFYLPAHGLLWDTISEMHRQELPISVDTLAEELKSNGQLEAIGGLPFLVQVSSREATTAQAGYFIAKLKSLHKRREALTIHAEAIEHLHRADSADIGALLGEQSRRLELLADSGASAGPSARSLMALSATEAERQAANLLGNGFLRRGQGLLLPGATGIGKSSLAMQAAILWALGRPFFGIRPQGPLTSLIVQAENDEIDLVEIRDGICDGLDLTADQRAAVASRLHVITLHERGAALFLRIAAEVKRLKIDLLILDPLFAYIEGGVKDQEAASAFLRGLMQPFLVRHGIGAIVLHHTNKPPSGREKSTWQAGDFAYAGSGSIEFANWARAVIVLRSIGKPDVFELLLPKRGRRAGVCDMGGDAVTSLFVRHSRKAGAIFWEEAHAEDARMDAPDREAARVVREFFSLSKNEDEGVPVEALARRLKYSAKTLRRRFDEQSLLSAGGDTLCIRDGRVYLEGNP